MTRLTICLTLLLAAGLPATAQDSPLIFGSDLVQPMEGGSPTNLYQIDLEAEASTVLGTFGDEVCIGLEIYDRGLYSLCRSEGEYFLIRLDEDGPPLFVMPVEEPEGGLSTSNAPQDFLLTDDFIVIINLSFVSVPVTIPTPPFRELRIHDRTTGALITRLLPTSSSSLSADPADPQRPFALMRDRDTFTLGRLNLDDFSEDPQVNLPQDFQYHDFSFDASTGDFLAIVQADPEGKIEMARLRPQQGEVQALFEVSQQLRFLEVNNPVVEVEETELIAPILVGSPLTANRTVVSTLTFFNASSTTEAAASMLFFNDQGSESGNQFCPGGPPVPGSFPVGPSQLLSGLLNDAFSFAGWGLVRTTGPMRVLSEVAFVDGQVPLSCRTVLEQIPSTRIQTAVEIPLVEPATSFAAPATITPARESALAIVNPDPLASATVDIQAIRSDGATFDFNEVVIGPRQRKALLLFEWLIEGKVFVVPPQRPEDFRGSLRIRSDRPVAVAGLTVLLPEGKWSNLPVQANEDP